MGQNNDILFGYHRLTGGKVAIKVMDESKYIHLKQRNGISECLAQKICSANANVLSVIEKFKEQGQVFIVTKLIKGGDLTHHL